MAISRRGRIQKKNTKYTVYLTLAIIFVAIAAMTAGMGIAGRLWSNNPIDSLSAPVLYVSPSGSDNNPGTLQHPLKTIGRAVQLAQPGYTIYLRKGNYNELVSLNMGGITLKSYPGERASIDGSQAGRYQAVIIIPGRSGVSVEDLEIRGAFIGILAAGPVRNLKITGSDIHSNVVGIVISGTNSLNQPANTVIKNNKIRFNGGGVIIEDDGGYYLIEGNEFSENANNYNIGYYPHWVNISDIEIGVNKKTHHVVVRGNKIWNNKVYPSPMAVKVQMIGPSNTHYLFEDNELYYTGASVMVAEGVRMSGSAQVIARRNIITDYKSGFLFVDQPVDTHVYHNTIDNTLFALTIGPFKSGIPQPGASFAKSQQTDLGLRIKNNLITNPKTQGPSNTLLLVEYPNNAINIEHTHSLRLEGNAYKPSLGSGYIEWKEFITSWMSPKIYAISLSGQGGANAWFAYLDANKKIKANQDKGSTWIDPSTSNSQVFVNHGNRDFHPATGSPVIDSGAPLTITTQAGQYTTQVPVDDAGYFVDSWGGLNTPDEIRVGSQRTRVVSIDYQKNIITVDKQLTFKSGEAVSLAWEGAAPEPGKYEWH